MKRRFDEYDRLARGLFGVSSLWLSPKDVLYVRGTGVLLPFAEDYIRFDLARIQSAAIVKTRTGMVLNLVFGGLALVLGGLGTVALLQALSAGGDIVVLFYALSFPTLALATVFLVLFLINLALGPTCHFQLQTATRLERVRPVRRLRVARRVLARLTPVLQAAQVGPVPAGGGGGERSVGSVGSEGSEGLDGSDGTGTRAL